MLSKKRIAAIDNLGELSDGQILLQTVWECLDAYEELQAELSDAKNDATVATAVANNKFVTHCGDCGSELSHLATIDDKPGWLNIAVETCEYCNEANLAKLQSVVAKLPKTVDGVPVFIGMDVWLHDDKKRGPRQCLVTDATLQGRVYLTFHGFHDDPRDIETEVYSTRETAAKAGGEA